MLSNILAEYFEDTLVFVDALLSVQSIFYITKKKSVLIEKSVDTNKD